MSGICYSQFICTCPLCHTQLASLNSRGAWTSITDPVEGYLDLYCPVCQNYSRYPWNSKVEISKFREDVGSKIEQTEGAI